VPIVKAKNRVDAYRAWASASDVSELSGRAHRSYLTEFVSERILAAVKLRDDASLLDVGCGDGTLLIMARRSGARGRLAGVLPSSEEVDRVRRRLDSEHPGSSIAVTQGFADALPVPDDSVDCLVCNGVLHIVGSEEESVGRAIAEIARVTVAGGTIYIGEVPDRDEFAGEDYGSSLPDYLRGVYRHQGFGHLLKALRRLLASVLGSRPFVYGVYSCYFSPPETFTRLLERHGIQVESHARHQVLKRKGRVVDSPSRWNYLCRKT
jgi:ubiquinone/menaquinone biosynthesis C-methylase UbiE